MSFLDLLMANRQGLTILLGMLTIMTMIEALIPLHPRGVEGRAHIGPNLGLIALTFFTNMLFNAVMLPTLLWLQAAGVGLIPVSGIGVVAGTVVTIIALDLTIWCAHVSMHKVPVLWRFHMIHHSDPMVDVTTSTRQHPGESLIRYGFMGVGAICLGATPAAFALYRLMTGINSYLLHANINVPQWLDEKIAWVAATPTMHKVHHSRNPQETDSNYGNLLTFWDRLFHTFTPVARGRSIQYGLNGEDLADRQTFWGLLIRPFKT